MTREHRILRFSWVPLLCLAAACAAEPVETEGLGGGTAELETAVESFDGLPGYYKRVDSTAPPEELRTMWLVRTRYAKGEPFGGFFARRVERECDTLGCEVEQGSFDAVPENPAIGFAFLRFEVASGGSEYTDHYIVDGLARDATGQVVELQLWKATETGDATPFRMRRVF